MVPPTCQLEDCPHWTGQCLSLLLMLQWTCQALSRNTVKECARPTARRGKVSHFCPAAQHRHAQEFMPGHYPGFLNPHSYDLRFRPGSPTTALAAGVHLDVDEVCRALQLRGRGAGAVPPSPHDTPGILSLFLKSLLMQTRTRTITYRQKNTP